MPGDCFVAEKHGPRLRVLALRCLPPRRGNHIPAQGNALGKKRKLNEMQALKGRHNRRTCRRLNPSTRTSSISCMRDVSRLQGRDVMVGTSVPRALPWADLLRPLRGQVHNSATPKLARRVSMNSGSDSFGFQSNLILLDYSSSPVH